MTNRLLPLLLTALVVGSALVYYRHTSDTIGEDRWLAVVIAAGWFGAVLRMLVDTRRWRLRNLALLVTFIGLFLFFWDLAVALWGWEALDAGWYDEGYRACFTVSAPVFLGYSLWWLVARPLGRWDRSGGRT